MIVHIALGIILAFVLLFLIVILLAFLVDFIDTVSPILIISVFVIIVIVLIFNYPYIVLGTAFTISIFLLCFLKLSNYVKYAGIRLNLKRTLIQLYPAITIDQKVKKNIQLAVITEQIKNELEQEKTQLIDKNFSSLKNAIEKISKKYQPYNCYRCKIGSKDINISVDNPDKSSHTKTPFHIHIYLEYDFPDSKSPNFCFDVIADWNLSNSSMYNSNSNRKKYFKTTNSIKRNLNKILKNKIVQYETLKQQYEGNNEKFKL